MKQNLEKSMSKTDLLFIKSKKAILQVRYLNNHKAWELK